MAQVKPPHPSVSSLKPQKAVSMVPTILLEWVEQPSISLELLLSSTCGDLIQVLANAQCIKDILPEWVLDQNSFSEHEEVFGS